MRTVTFSEAETVKALNSNFVSAWANRRPELKFKDGLYPATWKPRSLPNGAAVTNVTSVFAASDGTIVHAIPGYLDGAEFRKQLDFAFALHAKLYDPKVKRADRAGIYAEAHRKAGHDLLANRFMRTDEMPFDFFDSLGNVFA